MKTTDMVSSYELGGKIIDALAREKILAGDVVSIDKTSGKITKLGRSFARARDYDAMGVDVRFPSHPHHHVCIPVRLSGGEMDRRRYGIPVLILSWCFGCFHGLAFGISHTSPEVY